MEFTIDQMTERWPTVALVLQELNATDTVAACVEMAIQMGNKYLSLCEAVWPGKGKWEPTEEQPQQDFFEACAEAERLSSALLWSALDGIRDLVVKSDLSCFDPQDEDIDDPAACQDRNGVQCAYHAILSKCDVMLEESSLLSSIPPEVKRMARLRLDGLAQAYYQAHKRSFTPMYPWVFVWLLPQSQERGGIVLPAKQNKTIHEGIVLKTWKPVKDKLVECRDGTGKVTETYRRQNLESALKPGDHVLFPHWSGHPVEGFEREKFRLVREDMWAMNRDGGVFATLEEEQAADGWQAIYECLSENIVRYDNEEPWTPEDYKNVLAELQERFILVDRKATAKTLSGV